MSLLSIVVALVAVGIVLWGINAFIPMDSKIRILLNAVVVVVLVVWLLQGFGACESMRAIRVG